MSELEDAADARVEAMRAAEASADITAACAKQELSDLGNAERLRLRHGQDLRYCYAWRAWICWDGCRWQQDASGEAMRRAQDMSRQLLAEAAQERNPDRAKALATWALRSGDARRLAAALEQARPMLPVSVDELDQQPGTLCCCNGVVTLATGTLRPHRRDDLITRMAGADYDPNAHHPALDRLLSHLSNDDVETKSFLGRCVGMSAAGDVTAKVLFLALGPPDSGKGTLLEAARAALGDYATVADLGVFVDTGGAGRATPEVANLRAARFAYCNESSAAQALDASKLKRLVGGGDRIRCRPLYTDGFEFAPEFTLWLASNHPPRVPGDDAALWNRIIKIPFDRSIPQAERDPSVKSTLMSDPAARAAMLAWIVGGAHDWFVRGGSRKGLGIPPKVVAASEAYRAEQDDLGRFLGDCAVTDREGFASREAVRKAYLAWHATAGEGEPLSGRSLIERMDVRARPTKRGGVRGWTGWKLGASGALGADTEPNFSYARAREKFGSQPAPSAPSQNSAVGPA